MTRDLELHLLWAAKIVPRIGMLIQGGARVERNQSHPARIIPDLDDLATYHLCLDTLAYRVVFGYVMECGVNLKRVEISVLNGRRVPRQLAWEVTNGCCYAQIGWDDWGPTVDDPREALVRGLYDSAPKAEIPVEDEGPPRLTRTSLLFGDLE